MAELVGGQAPSGPHATLSRELADFLIELSIALHKHAMYPEGHPSLAPATDRVIDRLNQAVASRGSLSLGVARNQLVIEGVATDSKNAVLKDLAGRMHRHHLGAVTFRAGTTPAELHNVLTVLAVEADRSGAPLGLGPKERLNAWLHVRLHPLTYDRLDLIDDQPREEGTVDPGSREARTRAAQLWLGLARAALAAQQAENSEATTPTDPSVVAEAIEAHPRGTAYDQVIVGYLLQIADEVKSGVTLEERGLRRRVSRLITELDPGTLTRLLDMGGDRLQRRQFVLTASDGLAVDAVVDLVTAAGQTEGEIVSHSMLRMLSKLAQHARSSSPQRRALADQSVRAQVAELVQGWSLEDPRPTSYQVALRGLTEGGYVAGLDAAGHPAEPTRLLHMVLELEITGAPLRAVVRRIVNESDVAAIRALLASGVPQDVWRDVIDSGFVGRLMQADPLDLETLDFVLPQAGVDAAEPMLDRLAASESSHTRRALVDRLAGLGSAVGPSVVARLGDPRWYVQRNMLEVLRQLAVLPSGFDAQPFAEHPDARVRREAFHLLMRDPAGRAWGIARALADGDQRIVRLGLGAAMEGCPEGAVPLAAALANRGGSREERVMAIRALGAAQSELAIQTLLRLAAPRRFRVWLGRGAGSPEAGAAIAALQTFRDRPEVRDALARLRER